jgi:hypothetical protein
MVHLLFPLGVTALGGMRTTMRRAMHDTTDKLPPPRVIESRSTDDPQNPTIVEYRLAEGALPLLAAALERIDGSR